MEGGEEEEKKKKALIREVMIGFDLRGCVSI